MVIPRAEEPPLAWTRLQLRRALWLVKDVAFCARALVDAAAHARRADEQVAIGLLEGQPWAVAGTTNGYRLRLVNDTPAPITVDLALRGETEGTPVLEVRSHATLAARGVAEVFVVTDWRRRFELAHEALVTDPLAFLFPGTVATTCRLVARLESAGRLLDEATIVQPLTT